MDRIEDFEVNSPRWLSLEDFEGEVWKDIPDYEGWYQGSNMGRIKSVDRWMTVKRPQDSSPRTVLLKSTILKGSIYGMYYICHLKKHCTSKAVKVHRVICSLFHPNPDNLPEVNHINEIKTDNRAENLEWCTRRYNATWGTAIERTQEKRKNHPNISVKVYQYTLDGKFIAVYPSAAEAARCTGVKSSNIYSVCVGGKSKSTGGYLWSFSSNINNINKIVKRFNTKKKKEGKKVCQYNLDGQFVQEYISAAEASRQTGICKTTIINVCNHAYSTKTAGGYKWKYKQND